MNFDAIRLFVLVTKHLNITKAAKEIHLSQPAASRQLIQLQADLGVRLFLKSKQGVALTKAGRLFFQEVSPIFSQLEALQKKYSRGRASLTIACNQDTSTHVMAIVMAQFSQRHPLVQLTLHVGNSREVEELLLTSRIDLAVITNFSMLSETLFMMEPFRNDPLVAFVPIGHPLNRNGVVDLAQLRDTNLIIRTRRDGQGRTEAELKRLDPQGKTLRIGMRCESAAVVKQAVKHGAGVGILYYDVIKREIERGEFKVINLSGFGAVRHRYIVYSKGHGLSALAQDFLGLLRASVAQDLTVEKVSAPKSADRANGKVHSVTTPLRNALICVGTAASFECATSLGSTLIEAFF